MIFSRDDAYSDYHYFLIAQFSHGWILSLSVTAVNFILRATLYFSWSTVCSCCVCVNAGGIVCVPDFIRVENIKEH